MLLLNDLRVQCEVKGFAQNVPDQKADDWRGMATRLIKCLFREAKVAIGDIALNDDLNEGGTVEVETEGGNMRMFFGIHQKQISISEAHGDYVNSIVFARVKAALNKMKRLAMDINNACNDWNAIMHEPKPSGEVGIEKRLSLVEKLAELFGEVDLKTIWDAVHQADENQLKYFIAELGGEYQSEATALEFIKKYLRECDPLLF